MNFVRVSPSAEHRDRRHYRINNCHQNQPTTVCMKQKHNCSHFRHGLNVHYSLPNQQQHYFQGIWNVFPLPQPPRVHFQTGIFRLNKEIESMFNRLLPSRDVRQVRESLVAQISNIISSKWSSAKVEVFGSFKTNLYLPTSDIDLVVQNADWQRPPFYELKEELIAQHICDRQKIIILDNASVPIIKLTDKQNNIKLDIGFNLANAQESARLTLDYIAEFPSLPYLVIVLKQFLVERELNEVYTGGISSYSLILMIISFLRFAKKVVRADMFNYGHLLLTFLRFYAFEFDYLTFAVNIKSPCGASQRYDNLSLLSIKDPLCPNNDVARGSYRFHCVRDAFADAFYRLVSRLGENFPPSSVMPREFLILSEIVKIPNIRHCCQLSHYGDGCVNISSSTGSISSASSDAGSGSFGDTDSESEVPVRAVPSGGIANACGQQQQLSSDAVCVPKSSLSSSSAGHIQSDSGNTVSNAELTCSELISDKSVITNEDSVVLNRLANVKLRTERVNGEVNFLPDSVPCDDNNNAPPEERVPTESDKTQRILPCSVKNCVPNKSASSEIIALVC